MNSGTRENEPASHESLATRFWRRFSENDAAVDLRGRAPVQRGATAATEQDLRKRTAEWRQTFAALSTVAVALHEPDGFEFTSALIGALYAGKTVYLPGDVQPETCRALASLGVAFAGNFPRALTGAAQLESPQPFAREVGDFPPLNADEAHVVIFTSGSSGTPQAVPKRLSQLLAEVGTLERQFGAGLGHDVLVVSTVSHQHIYGLLFKILWPLHTGRTFESESVLYPEQLAHQLATRCSAVVSGPAHLKRLPESLDWNAVRHNAAIVFSSGGPLSLEAVVQTEKLLGQTPVEVYGSSETGGIAWRARRDGVDAPWTAFPNVEVRADDGRLAVRSPHLASGEWLPVEDFAEFGEDGRFVLKGRSDRLAKIEGKRVSLVAMEDVMARSGHVAEVRLVQLESARDEIGAVVVPSAEGWAVLRESGSQSLRKKLNDSLKGSVERIAHPRRWRWVDALPVNNTGKTTNAAMIALFESGGLALPAINVLSSSASEVRAELYVSPHLPVFDGHFREIPVLPGVAQVDWAMLFARRLFGLTGGFLRMEAVKFQKVYQPGPLLSMHLQWNAERQMLAFRMDSVSGSATDSSRAVSPHSSGRIFFDS